MAPIIPTYYKSKGTPIYRDTTDAPPKKYDKGGLIRKLERITNSTKKFNNGGGTDDPPYSTYNFWKNRTQPYDKFGNVNPDYKGTNKIAQLKQLFSQPLGQNMSPKSTQSDDKEKKDWLNPGYTVQNSYSDDGNTYTELITDRENDSYQYKRVKDTNTGEIKYFARDTRVKNSPWKIKNEGTTGYRAVTNLFGEDKTGYATSDARVDFINKELTKRAEEKTRAEAERKRAEEAAKAKERLKVKSTTSTNQPKKQYASVYDAVLDYKDMTSLQDFVDAFEKGERIDTEVAEEFLAKTIDSPSDEELYEALYGKRQPTFGGPSSDKNTVVAGGSDFYYRDKSASEIGIGDGLTAKEAAKEFVDASIDNVKAFTVDPIVRTYNKGAVQVTKDLLNTGADIVGGAGEAIYEAGDYFLGDGSFDMSDTNWITGNEYGSGLDTAIDIASVIPAGKLLKIGKFGKPIIKATSKIKNSPIVKATSSSFNQPIIQNISPKVAQSFPVLNKTITPNNLMTVGFGVPAAYQYTNKDSKSRQILDQYLTKGDNLGELIYDSGMNLMMASPLLFQGMGELYKGAAGGIDLVKSSPYVRDFKGGWNAYKSGEAKLGDLLKKEKIIRFNYSPTKYKFDPTDPTKGLFFQSSRNPDLPSYLKGATNQQEFYTTLANAKNYNLASQQNRLKQGLNVGGGSQMKGYGNYNDWKNWVNLSTERSIAGSKSAEMQNALSNLSKAESPKTMAELRTLINNPENYWKMKEATPYNLNLIKNLPANKYEYLLSPNMASNLSPTKVGNYESSLFDLWGKTYLQGQGYRTQLANRFNKAFTKYKPTLTRAKFTGEGGSAVESNVLDQDE
jgi:hypothetical protein